jgi:hypothetical protein
VAKRVGCSDRTLRAWRDTVPGFREAAEPRTDETADDPGLPEATLRELAASAKSEHVRLRAALELANRAEPLATPGENESDETEPDYSFLLETYPEAVVSVYALKLAEAIRACDDAGIEQPYLSALREALASMDLL